MYHTPSLTKNEITLYLIVNTALNYGINSLELSNIPKRLERACKQGTSEKEAKRVLDRWEDRPQDYAGKRFPVEKTKEDLLEDIRESLQLSFYDHILASLEYQRETMKGIDRLRKRKDSDKIKGLIEILLRTNK